MKRASLGAPLAIAALLAGCGGGSGGGVTNPSVAPARQFALSNFAPAGTVTPGHPVTVSFSITMPDGKTLTQYRTGAGPHTGIHLIIVRKDLGYIIHQHPPVQATGHFTQTVTFPAPGPYKVLVDVYPKVANPAPNFQLFTHITVAGAYHPIKLPPYKPDLVVDGYHFDMAPHPAVHAIQAQFLHVDVTNSQGQPVHFVPWFGALAHAIFFRDDSLDYFHTHICAPSAPNCGTLAGLPVKIAGSSAAPGKLTVGVLLALPGTWRLFLQMKAGGKVITAPYTLQVK